MRDGTLERCGIRFVRPGLRSAPVLPALSSAELHVGLGLGASLSRSFASNRSRECFALPCEARVWTGHARRCTANSCAGRVQTCAAARNAQRPRSLCAERELHEAKGGANHRHRRDVLGSAQAAVPATHLHPPKRRGTELISSGCNTVSSVPEQKRPTGDTESPSPSHAEERTSRSAAVLWSTVFPGAPPPLARAPMGMVARLARARRARTPQPPSSERWNQFCGVRSSVQSRPEMGAPWLPTGYADTRRFWGVSGSAAHCALTEVWHCRPRCPSKRCRPRILRCMAPSNAP